MNKLIQAIEMIRGRLPKLRRQSLKETPTRTIVIDPLLEALGWDVRDPDEVELEYPTVDGKSVDYALKLNRKPVLLIEAKELDDALTDVKSITQVVGYAANDGIVWCILTNGAKWRVYRSVEKCPAPEKLMFEVNLDPKESEGMTVGQIARQMWRFSSKEMAAGTLDALGEQTFTDGKVRKALNALMSDPPRVLLNLLRKTSGDDNLEPLKIKESLSRIAGETGAHHPAAPVAGPRSSESKKDEDMPRVRREKKTRETRRAKKGESTYDEAHHISGKGQEAAELYRAVDRLCLNFMPGSVEKRYLSHYIGYFIRNKGFCRIHLRSSRIIVRLRLKYDEIENPPSFARNTKGLLRHSPLDFELTISNRSELDEASNLIRGSFDSLQ